jgi:hypothetical protein
MEGSMNIKLSALLLFFLATVAEAGSIYKWVDEQGVTHYSAASPTNKKAEQVKTQAAPPVVENEGGDASMKNWAAKEKMKEYKQRRDQQEAAQVKEAEERKNRCSIAKQQLGKLMQQGRIYKLNENGEKVYWDDDFHDAEIIRMKREVESNCQS